MTSITLCHNWETLRSETNKAPSEFSVALTPVEVSLILCVFSKEVTSIT